METKSYSPFLRRTFLAGASILTAAGLFAAIDAATPPQHTVALKHDNSTVERGPIESASFAGVVKRVSPSVVKITVEMHPRKVAYTQEQNNQQLPPQFNNPLFRQFFGNQMPTIPDTPEGALGSGVIVSADGYIVTNNHVVANAKQVTVTLSDGREFPAHVIGRDPQTDVAVIKVNATNLPAITFASSGKVEVGDRVLAIGNPFGIGETVTTGIVSATQRHADLGLAYEDFIQTDAAINPGNSGGALVDVDGRLVGINTAIISHSGGFQGVGLAVPADLVSNVVDNLVAHGKVVRGYVGMRIQDLTPTLADSFGLKTQTGALIADVESDGPGARAGLKSGDVVTAINGNPVDSASRLSLAIGETAPGTKVNLDVLRDGKTQQISVTTANKPNLKNQTGDDQSVTQGNDQGVLNGVGVSDLDSSSRRDLNLPERFKGALVTQVDGTSSAARAGIREGDVILEINHHPVDSAQSAVDLSSNATSRKTLVKLWSHGNTLFVVVDESDASTGDSGQ